MIAACLAPASAVTCQLVNPLLNHGNNLMDNHQSSFSITAPAVVTAEHDRTLLCLANCETAFMLARSTCRTQICCMAHFILYAARLQVSIATCVVGPLEYSTATLCLAHSVPFIYVKQGKSSDEPFICSLLHNHGLGMEMTLDMYNSSGTLWDECLDKLENWNRRTRKEFPASTYK